MTCTKLKKCSVCLFEKPTSEFNKNKTKKDGLAVSCKDCNKKASKNYYQTNKELHKQTTIERKKKNIRALRQYIYDLAKQKGCIDCSEHDPIVLEYDHIRGEKVDSISHIIRRNCSFATLQEELQKCVVRCANCHRRKTAKDQNWYADLIV